MMPCSMAYSVASVRELALIFWKMFAMCTLTVLILITNSAAISLLVFPGQQVLEYQFRGRLAVCGPFFMHTACRVDAGSTNYKVMLA